MDEYATAHDIADDPEFNWWVNQILEKRDRIISLVKRRNTRYLKKTSKYGIGLPKFVDDAYLIDKKNVTPIGLTIYPRRWKMLRLRLAFCLMDKLNHEDTLGSIVI